jgi:flagellin-like protein
MRGVSAIIAIILILMIVVALAALAYTWFTGIFGSLTTSATNATATATTAMGMQVRIEAAKSYGSSVNATIRNTGTVNVDISKLGVYVDGSLCPNYAPNTSTITPGLTKTINITNTTAACPNKVLKITIESGFEDYKTIIC